MSEAQMRRISYLRSIVKDRDAEIERLRAALKTISDMTDYGTETATWRMTNVIHNTNVIARAALEGRT